MLEQTEDDFSPSKGDKMESRKNEIAQPRQYIWEVKKA